MRIDNNYFTDESAALAEIEAAGYHPMTFQFGAESTGEHWHDFDAVVFILEGELTLTDSKTGEQCSCVAGTRIDAPKGALHSEDSQGYRALVGFADDPATLTEPINKPPPVQID